MKDKRKTKKFYSSIHKIYAVLKDEDILFKFKKLQHNYNGVYDPENEEILIDFRGYFIPTIIHESLHIIYPEWKENEVLKEEKRLVNLLSQKQVANIIKLLALRF